MDLVGYAAAVFYILLIPSFLLYLYWRQRAVLRTSGTASVAAGLPSQQFLQISRVWRYLTAVRLLLRSTMVSMCESWV